MRPRLRRRRQRTPKRRQPRLPPTLATASPRVSGEMIDLCPVCQPYGIQMWNNWRHLRCPLCLGARIMHCCDGLTAANDFLPEDDPKPPWWKTPFDVNSEDLDGDDDAVL
jgi:hypothetical protein